MPDEQILEKTVVRVKAKITRAIPPTETVRFVFKKNGTQVGEVVAQLEGKTTFTQNRYTEARGEFTAPDVDAAEKNYRLTYECQPGFSNALPGRTEYVVWPGTGKLTAKRNEDQTALQDFKFKVVQNGRRSTTDFITAPGTGATNFTLEKGAGFTIEAQSPFEIKKWNKPNGTALTAAMTCRDIEVEAVRNFVAEFVGPVPVIKSGALQTIKQYVNLPSGNDRDGNPEQGRDGKGPTVTFKLGVKGDRPKSQAQRIGKAGVYVHVKVVFTGTGDDDAKKCPVVGPRVELGGDLKAAATEVRAKLEYTAQVELKQADGTGLFTVNLGTAGGDICKVFIGSTSACGDAELHFENWRRVWYELMAPAFIPELEDNKCAKTGGKMKDFPAAARDRLTRIFKDFHTEIVFWASHIFTVEQAPAGTVYPQVYAGLTGRRTPKAHVLTDYSFQNLTPTGHTWDDATANVNAVRTLKIWLCDKDYYYDPPSALKLIAKTVEVKNPEIDLAKPWVTHSSDDNNACITELKWEADLTDLNHPKATVTFVDDDLGEPAAGDPREIELKQGTDTTTLTFTGGMVGNIATELTEAQKTSIFDFAKSVTTRLEPTIVGLGNTFAVTISANTGNDRRAARISAIKTELAKAVKKAYHAGRGDDGKPLKGDLDLGTVIDMTRSQAKKLALNLPETAELDPGKLVGTPSDTKCRIKIKGKYKGHGSGLGMAVAGAKLLVVWKNTGWQNSIDTALHEAGHNFKLTNKSGWNPVPPADMTRPKTVDEAQVDPYKNNGTKGHVYDNARGGSGSHCSWGMSDVQKNNANYNDAHVSGTCLMMDYGPSDGASPFTGFCPQCSDFLRAADLSTLP